MSQSIVVCEFMSFVKVFLVGAGIGGLLGFVVGFLTAWKDNRLGGP